MKRLDQLTFTRFIAILVVLFFHGGGGVYFQAVNIFPISPILISATTSVTYLYVLSGFVMSLVNYRPTERFDVVRYWTARFVRLYPLYLISFLLVCYYYLDFIAKIKPQKMLVNIFVLQAWVPKYAQSFNYASWSMTVEFFFYAIFPFFSLWAYRQSTKKLIRVSIIIWVATQMIHNFLWIIYFPEYENFLVYSPLFHLSSFILGAVGGIWYLSEGREQQNGSGTTLLVLTGSVLLVSSYTIVSSKITIFPHGLQLMTGLLAPVLTIIIVALALDKSRLSTFLNRPALVALGETSYGLYILHVRVIWIYKRALENSFPYNPQLIFDYTFLPLMVGIGLLIHLYIDQPLRSWLKNLLRSVSISLLLLDFLIVTASIFISFRLRFGVGPEYLAYRPTGLLMFWSAFVFRTGLSVALNAVNPKMLSQPFKHMIRPLLISISAGSLIVSAIVFAGYSAGWFENFPRSIFLFDWLIIISLSLMVRYIFHALKIYKQEPLPL